MPQPSKRGNGPRITVERITLSGGRLDCLLRYDTRVQRCFNSSDLYFNYDFPLESIPPSVLSIPILGVLAPLGWVSGATIAMQEVDDHYLSSVHKVAGLMQGMYPKVRITADVACNRVDTPWPESSDRTCLLYSGGVDSTASLLRNLGPNLSLVTVRGTPDLRLGETDYWDRVERQLSKFIRSLGVERHIVETNAIEVVNTRQLNRAFRDTPGGGWWENLAHGILLLSLCAPYTYAGKISRMMIAASYSQAYEEPWGSTPASDQSVGWGALTTVHDSFDLTRIQKVTKILAPYMAKHPGTLPLRVCTGHWRARLVSGALNCGICLKCARQVMIFLSTGIDPVSCGFPAPNFAELKEGFSSGRLIAEGGESLPILHAAKTPPTPELAARYPGLAEFLSWFYRWEMPGSPPRRGILGRLAPSGSRRRRVARAVVGRG